MEELSKKSLKNSLEGLQRRLESARELADYSQSLVEKFNDPYPEEACLNEICGKASDIDEPRAVLDMIDLFNQVIDGLEVQSGRIGDNLSRIENIIE